MGVMEAPAGMGAMEEMDKYLLVKFIIPILLSISLSSQATLNAYPSKCLINIGDGGAGGNGGNSGGNGSSGGNGGGGGNGGSGNNSSGGKGGDGGNAGNNGFT